MRNDEQERRMLAAFDASVKTLLTERERFIKNQNMSVVGLESEVTLYSETDENTAISVRDQAVEMGIADMELGALQVELRTPPISVAAGISSLHESYKTIYERFLALAHANRVSALRIGANPFLQTIGAIRSKKEKYARVPDFNNHFRRHELDTIIGLRGNRVDIGDATIISLFQAFQVNLEARSLDDAVDLLNRSLMISPFLLALAGNARYLECTDTGYNDLRIHAWEISHDIRTIEDLHIGLKGRMGLPEKYFTGIEDYFERLRRFPFILYSEDHALQIAIGLAWLDARIKFIHNSAIVELRSLPTQPTIKEELVLTAFYLGRLTFSQITNEPLLPFSLLEENRITAITQGLCGTYWHESNGVIARDSGICVLEKEIDKAQIGWNTRWNTCGEHFELLYKILRIGSPSDRLAQTLRNKGKVSRKEMLDALQKTNMLI